MIIFLLMAVVLSLTQGGYNYGPRYLPCLIATVVMLALGLVDDFYPLSPPYKLLIHFIVAIYMVISGFSFKNISYVDIYIIPRLITDSLSVIWIVGIINAFNFIDGIDGLAGGLSVCIFLIWGIIFHLYGAYYERMLMIIIIGTLLGFLIFNFPLPKARIFMGDSGSQSLGFLLALMPLLAERENIVSIPVLNIALLMGIFILETIATVWRRIRDKKNILNPDMPHVHHKLLNLGLSVLGVDAVLYSLQIILGVLFIVSIRLDGLFSLYVIGAAYIVSIIFFSVIHFMNRKVIINDKD